MTVFQALDQIARTTRNSGMRTICQRMSQRIQNGDGLSVAMSEFPRAFPSHVVGVVAAGELGGFLPVIVGDIAFDYELTQRASSKWVSWISKLGWLNAAGVLFISPFLPLAVPILAEKGIPGFPAAFGVYLKYTIPHVGIPILLAYGGYYIAGFLAREPSLRPVAQRLLLRMPVYGKASKMRSLASFSRMFWRLQNAGLLPIRAWEAASRAAVNPEVAERLQAQIPVLQSGRKISDAFSMTGLFSEDDIRLLSMAETGGQIVESLERMAAYYEDAAVTSTNGPKQVAVHAVLLVNLIVMAYCFYCVEIKTNLALFDYVDKLFKAD